MDAMDDGIANVAPAPVPVDSLHCIHCAYPLRGLDAAGNCPECGTPIQRSIGGAGEMLRHAEPAWLHTVAQGFTCSAFAGAFALLNSLDPLMDWLYVEVDFGLPFWSFWTLSVILDAVAVWWITTPEPRPAARLHSRREGLRIGTRYLVLATDALALGWYFLVDAPNINFLLLNLWIVASVLAWLYVRELLVRIPRPGLALATMFLMVGSIVSTIFADWTVWVVALLGIEGSMADVLMPPAARYAKWAFMAYAVVFCVQIRFAIVGVIKEVQGGDDVTENSGGAGNSHAAGSPERG